MLKKLDNKGMTVIEILVSFVLVSTIVVSMFSLVSKYAARREQEVDRNSINTYKTTLTKEIYDDIINSGGIINATSEESGSKYDKMYTLKLKCANTKEIEIVVVSKTMCYEQNRDEDGTRIRETIECSDDETEDDSAPKNIDIEQSSYYVSVTYNGITEQFDLPKIVGLQYNEIIVQEKYDHF